MPFWEWIIGVGTFAFGVFVYLTTDNKGRFLVFVFAAMLLAGELYCHYRFDMSTTQYVPRKVRYCSETGSFLGCFFSEEYERTVERAMRGQPTRSTCDLCPLRQVPIPVERIRYVHVAEQDLGRADVDRLRNFVGLSYPRFRGAIGQMIGISNLRGDNSDAAATNTVGDFREYLFRIRNDNVLPELVSLRSSCVRRSELVVSVTTGGIIASIEWLGTVEKTCFDLHWLPALGRLRDFQVDEQFRSRRVIGTISRSFDEGGRKLLVVTSRSPKPEHRFVGVRVGWVSNEHANVPWPIPEGIFSPFYRATEDRAQEG